MGWPTRRMLARAILAAALVAVAALVAPLALRRPTPLTPLAPSLGASGARNVTMQVVRDGRTVLRTHIDEFRVVRSRLFGPIRLGFLRSVEAGNARIEIDPDPPTTERGGAIARLDDLRATMHTGFAPRRRGQSEHPISGVTVDHLHLIVRRTDGMRELRVRDADLADLAGIAERLTAPQTSAPAAAALAANSVNNVFRLVASESDRCAPRAAPSSARLSTSAAAP